jgi:hypothetical protein
VLEQLKRWFVGLGFANLQLFLKLPRFGNCFVKTPLLNPFDSTNGSSTIGGTRIYSCVSITPIVD